MGAQLRGYLNAVGDESKLSACVIVDAAECWEQGTCSLDRRVPMLSIVLAKVAYATAKCAGVETMRDRSNESMAPEGPLFKMVRQLLAPCNGYSSTRAGALEYLRACHPGSSAGYRRPVLELCTYNDTIIDVAAVCTVQERYKQSPYVVTCATRGGTHVVRWEGWTGRCWICRSSSEFLDACLE